MKIRYVAIEREYGSGGTKIAREVAKQCGISCYGPEIMETVAQEQNCSVRDLEEYEERISGSLLYSFFVVSQSQTGNPDLLSQEAKLYVAETRVIRELAKSGPAIFVGHCACKALEDEEEVLRVFIHGSEEDKHRRITTDYGIDPQKVSATSRTVDRRRANYYGFCTRKRWRDFSNYDLILDSSTIGIEGCAELLSMMLTHQTP